MSAPIETDEQGQSALSGEEKLMAVRRQKVQDLREQGHNPYPYAFARNALAGDLHRRWADLPADQKTDEEVRIAGRIHALRNTAMFIDLHDESDKIQIFAHKQDLSPEVLPLLPLLDIGDLIGVRGIVRRTKRGELTVNAQEITVLSKALRGLPEKHHGLQDIELRRRQRYLDLMVSRDSQTLFRQRSAIIRHIRQIMVDEGFMEVETPMLHPIAGGAAAKPFITHHNALDRDLFLRIAPELYLKRLIVGGVSDKVFEINRNFRNEGISNRHNPEFTMIEGYQAWVDYHAMCDLVEKLVSQTAQQVRGRMTLPAPQQAADQDGPAQAALDPIMLDFTPPWPRKSMAELIQTYCEVDVMAYPEPAELGPIAEKLGCKLSGKENWGQIMGAIFEEKVEAHLIQPIHVIDFPKAISPLAKTHRAHPQLAERFESYINGWEIANAFSELSDPDEQRARFTEQLAARAGGDDEAHQMDEDYVRALEYGMPPTGGFGIGIDRLVMVLTGCASIRDVILFPSLR